MVVYKLFLYKEPEVYLTHSSSPASSGLVLDSPGSVAVDPVRNNVVHLEERDHNLIVPDLLDATVSDDPEGLLNDLLTSLIEFKQCSLIVVGNVDMDLWSAA